MLHNAVHLVSLLPTLTGLHRAVGLTVSKRQSSLHFLVDLVCHNENAFLGKSSPVAVSLEEIILHTTDKSMPLLCKESILAFEPVPCNIWAPLPMSMIVCFSRQLHCNDSVGARDCDESARRIFTLVGGRGEEFYGMG